MRQKRPSDSISNQHSFKPNEKKDGYLTNNYLWGETLQSNLMHSNKQMSSYLLKIQKMGFLVIIFIISSIVDRVDSKAIAVHSGITPLLKGIGYYDSMYFNGVWETSMAGGADIYMNGVGMSHDPMDQTVIFSLVNSTLVAYGQPLSQENAFNSYTAKGRLAYTSPSIMDLMGLSYEDLGAYDTFIFEVSLMDYDSMTQALKYLKCNGWSLVQCKFKFSRQYTPLLYQLSPPVMYYGSETSFWVDTKSAQAIKSPGELTVWEARIDGYTIDWDGYQDTLTTYTASTKNQIRGRVGQINPTNDAQVSIKFKVGQAYQMDNSMIRCDFRNETCYKARVVPVINSLDYQQGYTSGGQLLTIKGYGFMLNSNITTLVDDVPCTLIQGSQTGEKFTCRTGSQQGGPFLPKPYYIGSHGLRRKYYNSTTEVSLKNITNSKEFTLQLAMDLESQFNLKVGYSGNVYSGYFKAPATTRYRFYMSCDDYCQLYMSPDANPANKKLLSSPNYSGWRSYWTLDSSRQSDWVSLVKDEYYYIETVHTQYFGSDHVTVSLEIEDPDPIPGHHHSMREIQRFQVLQQIQREQWQVTVNNPDGGNFILNIQNPNSGANWASGQISTRSTEWPFQSAIMGYYSSVWSGATIQVNRTAFDSSDSPISDFGQAAKIVYTVTVLKSLPKASTNLISVQKVTTKSTFTVTPPDSYQISNFPMSGAFRIKCYLKDWATTNTTNDIDVFSKPIVIRDAIVVACPHLRDKIDVWDPLPMGYEDGRDFLIRYTQLNLDVPQFEVLDSPANPVQGSSVEFNSTTWVPYSSSNLFFEPLPFEFLYTNETQPQVKVSVNGIDAVCGSLDCGFTYIAPQGKISSYSLSGTTLTIRGTNLPTSLTSVTFSNLPCEDFKLSGTSTVTCKVTPIAGDWQPQVTDQFGFIPLDTDATISVPLVITSLTPNVDLNPNGGTVLEIAGKGFPPSLNVDEGSLPSVTFLNQGSVFSSCKLLNVTNTLITCMTQGFKNPSTGQTPSSATVQITLNEIKDTSKSLTIGGNQAILTGITPNIVSPVLKNILTVSVSSFPLTIEKSDILVKFTNQENSNSFTFANVIEAGNQIGNQFVKVKFGGAESGIYDVQVSSKKYGRLDSNGVTLQTVGKVTSFSPTSGSVHGGTLITIKGFQFSNDPYDNPVKIGYTDCLVETSTEDEITCRTLPRLSEVGGTDGLLVFLKTSEEAVCAVDSCSFTWLDSGLPALSSYQVDFDTTLSDYVLTMSGTNFGATLSNTLVLIDDNEEEIMSASDTEVKVRISQMQSNFTMNVKFFLPIGIPDGMEELTLLAGITLTPQLVSVTPNVGASSNSIILINIKGLGLQTNTNGLVFITAAGDSLCQAINIYQYGVLQCKTNPRVIADGPIKAKWGSQIYECVGPVGSCNYQTTSQMPVISQTTKSTSNTITLLGTGFNYISQDQFQARLKYAGMDADNVSLVSDTQVIATFNKGVPIQATSVKPELTFESKTSNITHWANNLAVGFANPITSTHIDAPLSCSFAGGCTLSISQKGLSTNMQKNVDYDEIWVCGAPCKILSDQSTTDVTKCSVPAIPTTYSVQNFNISEETYLIGTPFSSSTDLQWTYSVWDGNNEYGWPGSAKNCFIGTAFRAGYIGVLREVKYFMPRFTRATYVGKLKFQGSLDGITYADIFTVGEEIHEGWNYYTYPAGQELKFRFFRFFGTADYSCTIGEMSVKGWEVIDSNTPIQSCDVSLFIGNTETKISGQVTYSASQTPLLKAITPRYGTVKGGETIKFSGTGFSTDAAKYSISIDGKQCSVTSAMATEVNCVTAPRPGLFKTTSLDFRIDGVGNVATQGLLFRYTSYWSDETTWGGEFAPIDGDMVFIPQGLHLLVDIDSTPILSAVLVEGSLIFPPNPDPQHLRTFDANYVFIRGGYMEVGTEQFPYTSKLIITMHSNKQSPEIPIYGNKVIGVRNGVLDMHGVPRSPVWTELAITAFPGAKNITLIRAVDWQIGERIVIAPTGYEHSEAEERTIVAINRSNANRPVITLDVPLKFKHYSGKPQYGYDFIEMRAEVGLLTRNVVFRGNPETSAQEQFGAHIMIHSKGDESCVGRIEYIELRDVGQAFALGRYPIHFHLIGTVHKSYIRGNAIHHTYNRAVTIHAVHYLRVINNLAYNTKGHTFFIEDAVETKNYIENNLAIQTLRSWSLLNSDQFPASFWITHPDNIFRGNHAAGADNYGFWFDTRPTSIGPSYDPNICPENAPLGEFVNNVAHSNGKYGLRIFHKLIPRQNPCQPLIYDPNNKTDPYWQNPLITARFQNFTTYMNKVNGAIGSDVGDIRFENFKVADNLVAGIEFERTNFVEDGRCQINGALIIGRSENGDIETNTTFSHGIITPRTENFQVHNVSFYNFDVVNKSALGSCSHCWFPPSTDSGARTITFSNLYFDSSVKVRIRYQEPFRDIFYDTDGTLTGLGPKTWATPYWEHNEVPECRKDLDVYDGLICDSSVQVRRVVFHNYEPVTALTMLDMKIIQYDESIVGQMDNDTLFSYLSNSTRYSRVEFTPKLDPDNSWAIPFVTGHKYKIHWQYGVDFTKMQATLSEKWQPSDRNTYLMFNFTDLRERVDFTAGGQLIPNGSLINVTLDKLQPGDNLVWNQTYLRQIHFVANGRNSSRNQIVMQGYRCIGSCFDSQINTNVTIGETVVYSSDKLWSDPKTWPDWKIPKEGDDIVIGTNDSIVFDMEQTPIYGYIQINGRVIFKQDAPRLSLRARYIYVRAGELRIGNQTHPYLGQANITLYGAQNDSTIAFDNDIEGGNKILANTARLRIFGQRRSQYGRLHQIAQPNDTTIYVTPGFDWKVGERIALAPTRMHWHEIDQMFIQSYDSQTGELELDQPLSNYHYGAPESTAERYSGVDIRGEVMLLSRNIKIQGNDSDAWGCQIVTSSFIEENGIMRNGSTIMDSVEIYNCSQYDTTKAALRFESLFNANSWSHVSNSAIHNGLGIGAHLEKAAHVTLQNNTFFTFKKFGIGIQYSKNITVDGNLVIGVYARHYNSTIMGDVQGNIVACGQLDIDFCWNIRVINNIVAGLEQALVDANGYTVMGHECGNSQQMKFRNNTAHSIQGNGAVIIKDEVLNPDSQKCIEASYFTAYKCALTGLVSYTFTDELRLSNMIFIDNKYSAVPLIGQEGDDQWIKLKSIRFYGETDVPDCDRINQCYRPDLFAPPSDCFDRAAIMLSSFSRVGKPGMIKVQPSCPQHKIKSDASFGGKVLYENLTFSEFKSAKTFCGNDQRLFVINPWSADYIPQVKAIGTGFENVDQDAMVYLFTPPNEWANTDDCGEFPCTAPNNILLKFEKSTFSGLITPIDTDPQFQIISGNDGNSGKIKNCKKYSSWNAYYCQNEYLGILLFESLDADKLTRIFSPLTLMNINTTAKNVLNTMMDHLWDGFYTSQKRLSRFPALIEQSNGLGNVVYEIFYTGTPPGKQRFSLRDDTGSIIIRINYPKAGSYQIRDFKGQIVKSNEWDKQISAPTLIKGDLGGACGENRFVGVTNVLEFYMKKGCNITIEPVDSIQTQIRLNWTIDSFYADGGTTKFVDRMAASLGIKAQNIKVVSVYMGSVIVQFQVIDDQNGTLKKAGGVSAVEKTLKSKLTSGKVDLGAPILSFSVTTVVQQDTSVATQTNSTFSSQTQTGQDTSTISVTPEGPEKQKQAPIIILNNTQIIDGEDSINGGSQFKIVIGLIVAILVITLITSIAYYYYKRSSGRRSLKIKIEQGDSSREQVSPVSASKNIQVISSVTSHNMSPSILHIDEDDSMKYEKQYHPGFMFSNFGKNKQNQADQVIENQDTDERDENMIEEDLNPQSIMHTVNRSIVINDNALLREIEDELCTRTQNSVFKMSDKSQQQQNNLDEEIGIKNKIANDLLK